MKGRGSGMAGIAFPPIAPIAAATRVDSGEIRRLGWSTAQGITRRESRVTWSEPLSIGRGGRGVQRPQEHANEVTR